MAEVAIVSLSDRFANSAQGCAEFGEGGDDLVAEGVGFFVGEVGVHAAELEGDGEGVVTFGDALAFVDIKQPVVFEIGSARLNNGLVDFGIGDIFFNEDRDISAGGGVARDGMVRWHAELFGFETVESELGHDGCGGKARFFGDSGMDLAHDSDFGLTEDDAGLTGRVEAGVGGAALVRNGEVGGGGDGFEAAFEGEEIGVGFVGRSPAGGIEFSGAEKSQLGEFAGFGVDASDFEDVDIFEIVAALSVGEAGEDAVAEVRHFGAVGLADSYASEGILPLPKSLPGGEGGIGNPHAGALPKGERHFCIPINRCVERVEVAEGVGDGLVEPAAEGGFAKLVGEEFKTVGATDGGGADGELFGDEFVAVDAAKFFDKVFFALNVDAPGGGFDFEGITGDAEHVESEFGEVGFGLLDGDFHAEEFRGSSDEEAQIDRRWFGRVDVDDAADGFCSGDFGVKFRESVESGDNAFGIYGALESVAGFGEKAEFGSGFSNGGVDEVGGFEEAPGGGLGDFGFFAPHDARKTDGFFGIGYDHVVGLEFVGDAVEGFELFAGFGLTDDNALSGEEVEVVSVERLAHFEHDVVGEVNEEGDGALTDLAEAFFEPLRGFAVLKVFKDSACETCASFGLDFGGSFAPDIAVVFVGGGESGCGAGVEFGGFCVGVFSEDLSSEAEHRCSVASVRHDINVEHGLAFFDGDFFQFKAGHGEEVGDGFGVERSFDVITDHGFCELHEGF